MKLKITILLILLPIQLIFAACTTKLKSYLRSGPSTHSTIVRTLPRYSPVKILNRDTQWYHVKTFGAQGWVFHTLVDEDMNCMTLRTANDAKCPSDDSLNRKLAHNEGLKVLKLEIGCNYVQDKWGRKFWVNSFEAWPKEMKKLISF